MGQFYFDLYNDDITMDDEGRSLPDINAAHSQAVADARHMAAESVRDGRLNLGHYVEVMTDDREPLFRVTFGEVVEIIE